MGDEGSGQTAFVGMSAKSQDFKWIINQHYNRILSITGMVLPNVPSQEAIHGAFCFAVAAFEAALKPYLDEYYFKNFDQWLADNYGQDKIEQIKKNQTMTVKYRMGQLAYLTELLDRKGLLLEDVTYEIVG